MNLTDLNDEEIRHTASTVWDAFDKAARRKARKIAFQPVSKSNIYEDKVKAYFGAPCVSRNMDPLEFWKKNMTKYPIYFRAAKKTLAIPGSFVPSERV